LRLPEAHKISSSMSAKSCYRNNAVVESFLVTLKHELILNDDAETLRNLWTKAA